MPITPGHRTDTRQNAYDGEMEYWVVLKETGKRLEESSFEREHSKRMKAGYNTSYFERVCLSQSKQVSILSMIGLVKRSIFTDWTWVKFVSFFQKPLNI